MLDEYDWWGRGDRQPPPHLKTRRQLADLGLQPKQPVAIIRTRKFDCLLYDPDNPDSAAPASSSTQLDVLKTAGYSPHGRDRHQIERDRIAAMEWAQRTLADPSWTLLDTETTGARQSEMVEIGIIDVAGQTLMDTLVKAQQPISPGAAAVHGLTANDLVDAPTFPEIYPTLAEVLRDRKILIYNVRFDVGVINYCCDKYHLPRLDLEGRSECLMVWYAQWFGDWNAKRGSYKWKKLDGGHRALDDCQTALQRLKTMAAEPNE